MLACTDYIGRQQEARGTGAPWARGGEGHEGASPLQVIAHLSLCFPAA